MSAPPNSARAANSERELEQIDVAALLQHALKECGGRVEKAATRLGASKRVWTNESRRRRGVERPQRATIGA